MGLIIFWIFIWVQCLNCKENRVENRVSNIVVIYGNLIVIGYDINKFFIYLIIFISHYGN